MKSLKFISDTFFDVKKFKDPIYWIILEAIIAGIVIGVIIRGFIFR